MIVGLIFLGSASLVCGLALSLVAARFHVEGDPLVTEIEELLPGSQCGQCGFPGCSSAASALVEGRAAATICPPGGAHLARVLAEKLGLSLDEGDVEERRMVAVIEEARCIGCMKCQRVCPTDAIVGAPKQVHGVVGALCTACRQCVDTCPTETVNLVPIAEGIEDWAWPRPLANHGERSWSV